MLRWLAWVGILAGCGRYSFDSRDGAVGDGIDAAPDRANLVFLSAATVTGGFGGVAAADQICSDEATAAGLPGNFVAFLSDSTTNARDRLASSRGWTLRDGTPIGDTIDSMLTGQRVLNAIDMLADGTRSANGSTWTGSTTLGTADATRECSSWSDSTAASTGGGQSIRSAQFGGGNVAGCTANRRLLCFEVGHAHDVAVQVVAGRLVFVTNARRTSAIDVPAGDSICTTEATAASLPGTYRVALATSTASIASRFTEDARPWVRVDGTQVSPAGEMFTGTNQLDSFIIQHADGTYQIQSFWTGVATTPDVAPAANQACNDWASFSATLNAGAGQSHQTTRNAFWSGSTNMCSTNFAMLCMQQ